MKTKKIHYLILFLAVAAFNVIAFSSGANETEKYHEYPQARGVQACYQTMAYCTAWKLQLSCDTDHTDQACRRYHCDDCGLQ